MQVSFQQVDSSSSSGCKGTGLGLALVKRFVNMHDGNITVQSEIENGSTFTFIIPMKKHDV
ncbi:ATP-binding protein [Methanolobus sp.]|uniref:ATP-binding protein n=1 Tax=Methanolobus sp. TaxID=1874737 RepID=UPI0025EA3B5D|nr:ATP-binding protein [Methanolobus sp.]